MFKIVEHTLASAVAQSGTFTTTYPDGTSAGDFASFGHSMYALGLQAGFSQDGAGMSVSFGASEITVTYKGATSIPAGSKVICEFNQVGQNDRLQAVQAFDQMPRMVMSPLVQINLGAPDTADDNGILESQDLTALGVFSSGAFDGAYGDGKKAVLDKPRNVVAAWTGTAVLTVTGEDEYGNVMVEKSASGTSFTGKKAFAVTTDISSSANITALTVGTGDVLGLPMFLPAATRIVGEIVDGVLAGQSLVTLNADSPTLADAGQVYAVSPVAGEIVAIYAVTNVVVGAADAVITVKTAGGTVGTITVATAGSAVGTVDVISGIANGTVAAGGTIEFEHTAAPDAGEVTYSAVIRPTTVNGTAVAGVQTAPTATTGDVRGTYDPVAACDGSKSFALLAALPDPTYKGVDQYAG